MRLIVIAPLVFTIAAFVLSMLCLFAGSSPSVMQNYYIVAVNTSTLGYTEVNATTTSSAAVPSPTSLRSWLASIANNLTDTAKNEIETDLVNIHNGVASNLTHALGIQQWYSLHMLDLCYGTFTPNETAPGASRDAIACTPMSAMYSFDFTEEIQQEIANGPFGNVLNLSDLGYPAGIQAYISGLHANADAAFVLYIIGIAAAGVGMFTSIVSMFLTGRICSMGNFLLAGLSFLGLVIASSIITSFMIRTTNYINFNGNPAGISASRGNKFLAITWTPTALMFVASCMWAGVFCLGKKHDKKKITEKPVEDVPSGYTAE